MYKILTVLLLFVPFKMIKASWKPPLPDSYKKPLALENLDCDLKARPFTIIDELEEHLEDERLDEQEKKFLDDLLAKQNRIIDQYKIFYTGFIAEQKALEFNKLLLINNTITTFRSIVSKKMLEEFKIEIEKLPESRLKVEAKKLLGSEKYSGQRRDRK